MRKNREIAVIGCASGLAAALAGCVDGPKVLKDSAFLKSLEKSGLVLNWQNIIQCKPELSESLSIVVADQVSRLALVTAQLTRDKKFFTVLGGDHSCAIGTWSGVYDAMHAEGDLGLIWIDAHMDSHTPATSLTGNIHGMPLACLLGHGDPLLTRVSLPAAKLKPQHLCLIGVRSYEAGEGALLKKLGVKVFFMDEVKEKGIDKVIEEAIKIVSKGTAAFGLSLDIDSIDPKDAPGTGVAEIDGIHADQLCKALLPLAENKHLIATEIVEFDPHLDLAQKTEKLVARLMAALHLGIIID